MNLRVFLFLVHLILLDGSLCYFGPEVACYVKIPLSHVHLAIVKFMTNRFKEV